MNVGTIGFEGCKISCIIGNNEDERINPQDIFIDLKVIYDFSKAAEEDCFEDAICYAALADTVKDLAIKKQYKLLETLACDIIDTLMTNFKLSWVFVKIKKPGAIHFAQCSFVELERGKRA